MSKDHVFPKSWYSSSTPSSLQRWTVPACQKCNFEIKSSEEEVFITWGMAVDPDEQAAQGIVDKIKEMINQDQSKDAYILRIRRATFKKIISKFARYDPTKTHKGTGPKKGIRSELAITTSSKSLHTLAKKIITGLEYKIRNKYMEGGRTIKLYFPMIDDPLDKHYSIWEKLITPIKRIIELSPSFRVEYGINPKFDQVIYHVKIWNHYEFWGWVINEDEGKDPKMP